MIRPAARRAGTALLIGSWAALAPGCETLRPAKPADAEASAAAVKKPGGVHPPVRVGPFVFYADAPLSADDPLFKDLETLPDQVQRELRLPVGAQFIQVYLFPDQDRYEQFMRGRFPHLPPRRAYFITPPRPGSADDLQVYAYLGDHLRVDLRHELTHGLLHGVLKGVPLWLDEGLAGFFEQPLSADGVNFDHVDKLRKSPAGPDLARLEKATDVAQMERPEYREAWAWVHYCLRGDPAAKAVLLGYLQDLRESPTPGPLLPRLKASIADPNAGVALHVGRLSQR